MHTLSLYWVLLLTVCLHRTNETSYAGDGVGSSWAAPQQVTSSYWLSSLSSSTATRSIPRASRRARALALVKATLLKCTATLRVQFAGEASPDSSNLRPSANVATA